MDAEGAALLRVEVLVLEARMLVTVAEHARHQVLIEDPVHVLLLIRDVFHVDYGLARITLRAQLVKFYSVDV